MSTRVKIIITLITSVGCFAAGRYTAPEKVRVEVKTVEVEKKIETIDKDTNKNSRTKTTKVELTKPDGTKQITTTTETNTLSDSDTKTETLDQLTRSSDSIKEVKKEGGHLSLLALGGASIHDLSHPIFGAEIIKNVVGPVELGLWGLNNGTAGLAVGLEF